jgi:2-(1,2-epoxy-1,2-dihydrophenyl)acetyl-CoA isomerase
MKGVGKIVRTLREMPQPVIAMLKGVAVGGGANLALAGDFVIAADNARFCEIFVNIGLILDYGGTYFLPRLVGHTKARELAMLGNEIDGKTAAAIGLVYKSLPEDEIEKEVAALATTLAQKPPLALRLIKEGLEKSFDMSLKQVLDWEAAHQSIALQTPEHKEIVKLFLASKKNKS